MNKQCLIKKLWFIAGLIGLVLIFLVLHISSISTTKSIPVQKPLKIYCGLWPGFMPIVLADKLGYFASEGVAVEYEFSLEESQSQRLQFENGLVDGAAFAFATFVEMGSRSKNIRVILITDSSAEADAVIANPSIKTIKDLKGKRVAAASTGYGELVVSTMLAKNGMTTSDIIWIVLNNQSNALSQLKKGQFDALQIWEPYVSRAIKNGAHVIFSGADVPGLIIDALAFHTTTIAQRPEDVKKFLRAWFRAVDYWKKNPDEAAQIIAKKLNIPLTEATLQGLKLYDYPDNLRAFSPGNDFTSIYYTTRIYNDFFVRNNIITRPVSVNILIDESFVKSIRNK